MDSASCFTDECKIYHENDYENLVRNKLDSPMPWIGMYIAAASAVCLLAMAADAFNGFKSKKLWLPCKYFSLNAFSLTLLAVAMKLLVDLSGALMGNDQLALVSSLVFMSTAMANFMTCLGSMENSEIMLNLAALCILVITIAVNVCIRMFQMLSFYSGRILMLEQIESTVSILLMLVTLCSSAIMVPTAKKYIESVYQQIYKSSILNKKVEWGSFTIDELKTMVRRYWVMAQTGSLQFVIARSVICVTSGTMCLLVAIVTLLKIHITIPIWRLYGAHYSTSNYKWSIDYIIGIQSITVAVGIVAPVFRWFIAAKLKSSKIDHKSFKDELKVEKYWTQMLVDWRESPLPLQIRHRKFRKFVNDIKRLVLNFFIGVQIVIVLTSKMLLLISATCTKVVLLCYHRIKNLKARESQESVTTMAEDFSPYVVLLEGEAKLPKKMVEYMCTELDKLMIVSKKNQPKNLIKLMNKSVNFNGVRDFDNKQIQSLCSQEPPNCWSLPIVTLTSIATVLPNIKGPKSDQLLRGVSEGLYFAKLIEKVFDRNGELASIRNAADIVWVGVELYHKWLDTTPKSRSYINVLQELSDEAEKIMIDLQTDAHNNVSWQVKVIAANSMYRISQTIIMSNKDGNSQTEEELFERLSILISDILSACLTNLVHVIIRKCRDSGIKERERSVSQAAILLAESEEIIEMLQQRELPSLDLEKAAYFEEWRALMEQDSGNPEATVSATAAAAAASTAPNSNGEQVN